MNSTRANSSRTRSRTQSLTTQHYRPKFAYLTVRTLPRIHQAPARCTSETLLRPNLHTLQCARPLAGEICIPYSARAPWDSPCLGAVHSGGPSEANFAYLTVRAALGGRIFATFALHIGLGVEAGRQKLHTLTHELPLEFTRPLRGAGIGRRFRFLSRRNALS